MNRLLVAMAATAAIGLALATPTPAFAATACSASSAPVLVSVPQYDRTQFSLDQNFYGTANIMVALDETGNVSQARVLESTGFNLLDIEALRVAKSMRFASDGICSIAGKYSVKVTFAE